MSYKDNNYADIDRDNQTQSIDNHTFGKFDNRNPVHGSLIETTVGIPKNYEMNEREKAFNDAILKTKAK